jgi:predicted metalloprotease
MRWRRGEPSGDVIDARGSGGGAGGGGGGGLPFPMPTSGVGRGGGCLGLVLVIALLAFGGQELVSSGGGDGSGFGAQVDDPLDSVNPTPAAQGSGGLHGAPSEDEAFEFSSYVFDDVQRSWQEAFAKAGKQYRRAKLVIFSRGVNTACGPASVATGPFYCPADERVYLDLGFFGELRSRFGAPGDFAQAYVIAHEVGHHVQRLLGIEEDVRQRSRERPDQANALSVRLELQADCLAGVWAHGVYQRKDLEPGDTEEALGAAAAVGDDRIQQGAQGRISPETFTHGSSEQRTRWFRTGFDSGDANRCDTFSGVD